MSGSYLAEIGDEVSQDIQRCLFGIVAGFKIFAFPSNLCRIPFLVITETWRLLCSPK